MFSSNLLPDLQQFQNISPAGEADNKAGQSQTLEPGRNISETAIRQYII